MKNSMNTNFSPMRLDGDDADCPVCGLGAAFLLSPRNFDTCARCGWCDDPVAYADPTRTSATNEASLEDSIRAWPAVLAARLATGPISTLEIVYVDDTLEYVIDGNAMPTLFRAARGLRTTISWWATAQDDVFAPLLFGEPTVRGRIRLYACPLCRSDEEDALSADFSESGGRIIWSRIGFERNTDDNEIWSLGARSDPAGFAFDAVAYRRAFTNLKDRLAKRNR
jgi:hypothetical protein